MPIPRFRWRFRLWMLMALVAAVALGVWAEKLRRQSIVYQSLSRQHADHATFWRNQLIINENQLRLSREGASLTRTMGLTGHDEDYWKASERYSLALIAHTRERLEYHDFLMEKYRRAAFLPFLPLRPDPPEPTEPKLPELPLSPTVTPSPTPGDDAKASLRGQSSLGDIRGWHEGSAKPFILEGLSMEGRPGTMAAYQGPQGTFENGVKIGVSLSS